MGFRWHATGAHQRRFSWVWLISLGSKSGTPLYLNPQARVNTILTYSCGCARHAGFGCRETTAQRDAAAFTRSRAKSVRIDPQHLSPIAKILAPASVPMVSVAAWGEAWVNAQASAWALVVAWE